MMTTLRNITVVLLLFFFPGMSFASDHDQMDGKTLKTLCSAYQKASLEGKLDKDSGLPYMRCEHYMQGIVEASIFYERMMNTITGNHIFCFPKRIISTTQAILVTNEYIKKHPEKLESNGVILVMEAFFEAYSCNK